MDNNPEHPEQSGDPEHSEHPEQLAHPEHLEQGSEKVDDDEDDYEGYCKFSLTHFGVPNLIICSFVIFD